MSAVALLPKLKDDVGLVDSILPNENEGVVGLVSAFVVKSEGLVVPNNAGSFVPFKVSDDGLSVETPNLNPDGCNALDLTSMLGSFRASASTTSSIKDDLAPNKGLEGTDLDCPKLNDGVVVAGLSVSSFCCPNENDGVVEVVSDLEADGSVGFEKPNENDEVGFFFFRLLNIRFSSFKFESA